MLHRINGRASYFSPDIFIERCKDTKIFCILVIFLRFLIKNVTTQVGLSYSPMHNFPRCNQRE